MDQAFMQMIREHTGQQLDTWMSEVEASHLTELESFARGIHQDKAAVLAGLTLPWSNGPLEGHINRLKLIKRSMYGRAEFDLLKLRVLYQSKNIQKRKNKYKHSQAQPVDRLKKPRRMKNGTTLSAS